MRYNNYIIKLWSMLLLIGLTQFLYAQSNPGTIKGKVTNINNDPIEGINVGLEGTKKGAATNDNGNYQIGNITPGIYMLVVSSVGYQKQQFEIQIKAGATLVQDVQLNEATHELNEVIISSNTNQQYKVNDVSQSLRLQSPILETAQNIQVITHDIMDDQQIFDMLEGVTRNVSGVTRLEHWDNYARMFMRGTKIAPFRNGMNVEMPWGPLAEDMSMVERIEFVKGPAGFMLANGEPGGFYNVVTKKPTGETKGELSFTMGSFNTYRTTLDLDGKLSEDGKLLYRLNLMGQLKGSHRDFEYNNRYSIVPVVSYQISDQTTLTAEYTYQFSRMSAIGANYAFSANGYGELPLSFTTAEQNINPSDINDHSFYLQLDHALHKNWNLTAKLAYFNYNQQGSSLWPWSLDEAGNMQRGLGIWDAFNESKLGQIFVNGNLTTGPVNHRILAGLDMSYKNYMADWNQNLPLGEPINIYEMKHNVSGDTIPQFDRSRSLRQRADGNILGQNYTAVYVQDELGFWQDQVRLTLAGRYTAVQETEYGQQTDDAKISPRIGLSASLDEQSSVYGLYDQAFVPQVGTGAEGNKFKPVTGNNIEAGIKRDWFGRSWNTTLSVYQITKNNVLTADPENPNFSVQLGQTRTRGIEFDVRGELVDNLKLTLNYAYTDSEITEDTDENIIGNSTPGTTRHISNAWLAYHLPSGILRGLGLSLGYQWQAKRSSWYVFDGSEQSLPDYFRLDGSVKWQNESIAVSLNVNNLLDEYLYSGSYYEYGEYYYWQTEPQRNFRLRLAYKF